ncbi:butyrophilin subfamily 2 member A2-like [Perca fluviatilis]|uniref:butyrophilin subfamily 2 member A2-like n=1 Tax=Perca fluviatilis TaxID=8168 RepID=UPI001964F981|nr:butyrophilin subfamily 2 member A2-like [Perca fluviatilis]
MELLPLLCLCLLTRSGITSDQQNRPTVITVEGGADAVLPCSLSTKENIEFKLFVWRKVAQKDEGLKEVFLYNGGIHYNNGRDGQSEEFKGRVSHFPEELEHGNASIIIRNTKISDSGEYTCQFPCLQPPQIFHIKLVVDPVLKDRRRENSPGSPNVGAVVALIFLFTAWIGIIVASAVFVVDVILQVRRLDNKEGSQDPGNPPREQLEKLNQMTVKA